MGTRRWREGVYPLNTDDNEIGSSETAINRQKLMSFREEVR